MKKWIISAIGLFSVAALAAGAYFGWLPAAVAASALKYRVTEEGGKTGDSLSRIHFLNTGSSDAILLESEGRFALIDAGEDTEYPPEKPGLKARGYENEVLAYLKKAAGDASGQVTLDFVLGTHAHSDHIGGFDTILLDPAVHVNKAYLKQYRPEQIRAYEIEEWDNQEVYDQMISALRQRGVPVVDQLPAQPFALGSFTLQLFNGAYDTEHTGIGENDNSVGVLVEKDGKKAFLAGDLDNSTGYEDRLGPQIGKVDLLKVGHHGYDGSTSKAFVQALKPDVAIFTNSLHSTQAAARRNLVLSGAALYATVQYNGLVVEFPSNGALQLTKNAGKAFE